MSDTAAPAPAATASAASPASPPAPSDPSSGAPTAPPAAESAPSQAKGTSLADLKAARREKAAAAPAATPPAATPAAPASTAQATIEMDAGALKQFSTLSRELRDAKARVKELEGKVGDFGKFERASALAKDGKHYDAAREAGIDVDAALAELLGKGDGAVTASQIDKKLADEIADLKKFKDDTVKEKEDRKKAESEASVKQDRAITGKFVTDNAAKYPTLAKAPDLVDGVFKDYTDARTKLEADGETLDAAAQAKLMLDALAVHEEKWSKIFGSEPAAAPAAEPGPGIDGAARAGVREQPAPTKKKVTFEELKAERMARRSAR